MMMMISAVQGQERTKVVKPDRPLWRLLLHDLPRGLSPLPLIEWTWLSPLQNTSPAARDEGALEERHRHCLCFGFVEMLEQEAKAKPFYNVVNNSGY